MVGRTVSHYRIQAQLGTGGMGTVYLAEDTKLGRRVAVKFPLDDLADSHRFRARFLREARAASALNHPNIAQVYDYGETPEDLPYLVMEYVEGQPLCDLVAAGQLTVERSLALVAAVATALGEAHAHGVIHRDIKPANIFISERGDVKVLDFGLAKQLWDESGHDVDLEARTLPATLTQSHVLLGTPLYFSPEQAAGRPADQRSDLFALGTVLYECLTGAPAFPGVGVIDIAGKVLHYDPPPPSTANPSVPLELDRITLKALAKQPEARYQTAAEMQQDLDSLRMELTTPAGARGSVVYARRPTVSLWARVRPVLGRPRVSMGLLLGALVLVLLAGWGGWNWFTAAPPKPNGAALAWYEKGTNALRDGTYYKARLALEHAVEADDGFALAHARLAEALMELDYVAQAKDEILVASARAPEHARLPTVDALAFDAINASVRRDFAAAINNYQQLAGQVPRDEQVQVYLDLGRAYEKNEDLPHAIESYQHATQLDVSSPPAYLRLGVLYGRMQEQQRAEDMLAKAEHLYQDTSNYEGIIEVLYQRATLWNRLGRTEEARAQLLDASKKLDAFKQQGRIENTSQQISVLLQLSVVARNGNETTQAEQYAQEAVSLAQANGLENLSTQGLNELGNVFFARGDLALAEKYFQQALEFARRNNVRRTVAGSGPTAISRNEARALLSLGSLRIQQDNPNEGLTLVAQALPFFQQYNYRKEASQALLLTGRAQTMRGEYTAALATLKPLLDTAGQVNDRSQVVLLLGDIGTVYARQEQYQDALRYLTDCISASQALGRRVGEGFAQVNRSNVLWRLGRYAEAETDLQSARTIAEASESRNTQLAGLVHLVQARMALSQRRWPEALKEARSAQALDDTPAHHTALEAQAVAGVAQAFTGAQAAGQEACAAVVAQTAKTSDPYLQAETLFMYATALIESGQFAPAATAATQAHELMARAGQLDSAWRALTLAATAAQRAGDTTTAQTQFSAAQTELARLQQQLAAPAFDLYLTRPDVQLYRRQLDQGLPAAGK